MYSSRLEKSFSLSRSRKYFKSSLFSSKTRWRYSALSIDLIELRSYLRCIECSADGFYRTCCALSVTDDFFFIVIFRKHRKKRWFSFFSLWHHHRSCCRRRLAWHVRKRKLKGAKTIRKVGFCVKEKSIAVDTLRMMKVILLIIPLAHSGKDRRRNNQTQ